MNSDTRAITDQIYIIIIGVLVVALAVVFYLWQKELTRRQAIQHPAVRTVTVTERIPVLIDVPGNTGPARIEYITLESSESDQRPMIPNPQPPNPRPIYLTAGIGMEAAEFSKVGLVRLGAGVYIYPWLAIGAGWYHSSFSDAATLEFTVRF